MKDLMMLVEECYEELDVLEIEYARDIDFIVNTRAKRRWGQCTRHPNGTYTISISDRLLKDDVKDEYAKDTIIHELLHSVQGCMSHTGKWKRLAELVNDTYACYNIKRCTSSQEKGIEAKPLQYKYIVECTNCGYTYKRNRACNLTKYPSHYGCGNCGQFNTFVLR